ncbi:MAG: RNA-binding protein [Alphaproteobacteria bacterium]
MAEAGPETDEETMPERTCIASGDVLPPERMIRFVVGPDAVIVPDIDARLPGRGLWVTARRDILELACRKGSFARAARQAVRLPEKLVDGIEALLLRRAIDTLGLARRADQVFAGYEGVREALRAGRVAVLLQAADSTGRDKDALRTTARELPVFAALSGKELGRAFGADVLVHVAVAKGRLAERLIVDLARLAGLRNLPGDARAVNDNGKA